MEVWSSINHTKTESETYEFEIYRDITEASYSQADSSVAITDNVSTVLTALLLGIVIDDCAIKHDHGTPEVWHSLEIQNFRSHKQTLPAFDNVLCR